MVNVRLNRKVREDKFEIITLLRMVGVIIGLSLDIHSKEEIKDFMCFKSPALCDERQFEESWKIAVENGWIEEW